jgi:hypothetical protein
LLVSVRFLIGQLERDRRVTLAGRGAVDKGNSVLDRQPAQAILHRRRLEHLQVEKAIERPSGVLVRPQMLLLLPAHA